MTRIVRTAAPSEAALVAAILGEAFLQDPALR